MFIEHDPQTPRGQERRKFSVGSMLFLIQMKRAGDPSGRNAAVDRSKYPFAGFPGHRDSSDSLYRARHARARIGPGLPAVTLELLGRVNSAIKILCLPAFSRSVSRFRTLVSLCSKRARTNVGTKVGQ